VFEGGYEALKRAILGFTNITAPAILDVASEVPISLLVLRTMLGFTPPEWAYITTQRTGVYVSQGFARNLDRQIRMAPPKEMKAKALRIKAPTQSAPTSHQWRCRADSWAASHVLESPGAAGRIG
jgi:hypothetical protein